MRFKYSINLLKMHFKLLISKLKFTATILNVKLYFMKGEGGIQALFLDNG